MRYIFKKKILTYFAYGIDTAGYLLFFAARLFNPQPPKSPRRILIVRLDHIGDYVCTTPMFKNLKQHFPGAEIAVLLNPAVRGLAQRDPFIDSIIAFDAPWFSRNHKRLRLPELIGLITHLRSRKFDLGFDPRGDFFSLLILFLAGVKYRVGYDVTGGGFLLHRKADYAKDTHTIERNLKLLQRVQVSVLDKRAAVYSKEEDGALVQHLLIKEHCEAKRIVVMHPYAGTSAKFWPVKRMQGIITKLNAQGCSVALIGSLNDRQGYEGVCDLRDKISLPQLARLLSISQGFIGLDSGPANIAAALGVPAVVIASGTNLPWLWLPQSEKLHFVYKHVFCSPCFRKVCLFKSHECMELLTEEEVWKKTKEAFSL